MIFDTVQSILVSKTWTTLTGIGRIFLRISRGSQKDMNGGL
jgi:hypothetical protein